VSGTTRAVRMWCNNAFKRNEGRFGLKIMRLIRRGLLQLIDCERFLFDQMVPFDREVLRAYRSLSMSRRANADAAGRSEPTPP
jgi:hypothetical protein